jgi:HD-GYP domain-containing protein (c-di-GMP phosphodiesterase class II)
MFESPHDEEQRLLAQTFALPRLPLSAREWLAELIAGGAFLAAVAGLWLADPPRSLAAVPAVLTLLVLIAATRVRIDTSLGFTVPIQLAFVPLLFALPPAVVPLAVAAALLLGRQAPAVLAGRAHPSRLVHALANSWFAVGPAAVLVASGHSAQAAGAGLLLAALGAQFAVDFLASSARFRIARGASLSAQLHESWVYLIDAAFCGIGLAVAEEVARQPVAALAPLPLLVLLEVFARERHTRLSALLELNNAYRGTALVLGEVLAADDSYTGEHSRQVVAAATAVGRALGLSEKRLRNLEFASLLHDIGKVAVPKEIINKPGPLDSDEWELMTKHTLAGQRMLDRVGGFMCEVGTIVRSHHERWEGGGYPDGLRGEEIPLEARIISCCDAWNAMRTDRAYRRALPVEQAIAELRAGRGTQFDPAVVDVALEILCGEAAAPPGRRGARREASGGPVGAGSQLSALLGG